MPEIQNDDGENQASSLTRMFVATRTRRSQVEQPGTASIENHKIPGNSTGIWRGDQGGRKGTRQEKHNDAEVADDMPETWVTAQKASPQEYYGSRPP